MKLNDADDRSADFINGLSLNKIENGSIKMSYIEFLLQRWM